MADFSAALEQRDPAAQVRGMFVHPSQLAKVARRRPEVGRGHLVVAGEMANDHMTLKAAVAAATDGLGAAVATSVRGVTRQRTTVLLAAPGSSPTTAR